MVDTPGLLDRPMVERNNIEMQAIAALENVGDVLLFLIDPTPEATTSLEEQTNLLDEVSGLMSERAVLVVHSKSDLHKYSETEDKIAISSITGEGMEYLRERLVEMIAADEISDPLNLPEDWPRNDLA